MMKIIRNKNTHGFDIPLEIIIITHLYLWIAPVNHLQQEFKKAYAYNLFSACQNPIAYRPMERHTKVLLTQWGLGPLMRIGSLLAPEMICRPFGATSLSQPMIAWYPLDLNISICGSQLPKYLALLTNVYYVLGCKQRRIIYNRKQQINMTYNGTDELQVVNNIFHTRQPKNWV